MMGRCGVLELNAMVVLGLLSVVTQGRHTSPFFDPSCLANEDCSWHWQTPTHNGTQSCETVSHTDAFDICPNPFVLPPDFDNEDRPKPAEHIDVQDVSKSFRSSESGEMEQYTCLRISLVIDPYSASNVKGIQLSLRGKEEPDTSKFLCLSMNFSSGLEYNSVESHTITSECFCGLRPNRGYEVKVTTMPVDSQDGDHITSKSERHETADCNQSDKINDARCYKSKEALWEPDCILVEQNYTTGFYNLFDFSFNVATADYNFDKYQIFITPSPYAAEVPFIVDMSPATVGNKTCSQSNKSMYFVTVSTNTQDWEMNDWSITPGILLEATVKPYPTNSLCVDEQNAVIQCKTSSPQTFGVLSDPCSDNPCGVHGSCTSNVEDYICNCDPGFTVFDNTCKVDPCKILNSSDMYVSQCQNGECVYTKAENDFYCRCNANFVAHVGGKICLANPCAIIPETNATFCGVHGECELNITTDPAGASCRCQPGYSSKESKHECSKAKNWQPIVIGVAFGSCSLGLLLSLTIIFIYRSQQRKNRPTDERRGDPVYQHDFDDVVMRRKRVLPIYSADDHPLHYDVVVKFCRFLQSHCQCNVSLMEWEKSVGPTVEMWLTNQIEEADVVLLICSKGTGLKYMAKAKQKQMDSPGVYGDVFVKALFLLEDYFSRDNACGKFVVTYFDYSTEDDIPVPFKRFARYNLMQSMETLFLRIHNKARESPTSTRRVNPLHEDNYPKLEMGKWLYEAIEDMKHLVKSDKKWYHKQDSKRNTNGRAAFTIDNEQRSIDRHQGDTDSAYDTGDHNEPMAPPSFFQPEDRRSIGQDSNYSDFEESFKQIQNRVQVPLRDDYTQPGPQFFTDDISGMIDPEIGCTHNLNARRDPWDGIQMEFPQMPYSIESPI